MPSERHEVYPSRDPTVLVAMMNIRVRLGKTLLNSPAKETISPYVTDIRLSSTAATDCGGFWSRFKNILILFCLEISVRWWRSRPRPVSGRRCKRHGRRPGRNRRPLRPRGCQDGPELSSLCASLSCPRR